MILKKYLNLENKEFAIKCHEELQYYLRHEVTPKQMEAIWKDCNVVLHDNYIQFTSGKRTISTSKDSLGIYELMLPLKQSYNWFDILYGKDEELTVVTRPVVTDLNSLMC